jgi:ribonuclease HI
LEEKGVFKKASFRHSEANIDSLEEYEGYFDGCSFNNPGESGIGYWLKAVGTDRTAILRSEYIGHRTNNRAEMIALLLLLADAYCNGVQRLRVFGDSLLVINYMTGVVQPRVFPLIAYVEAGRTLSSRFSTIYFQHLGRSFNYKADALANQGALRKGKH